MELLVNTVRKGIEKRKETLRANIFGLLDQAPVGTVGTVARDRPTGMSLEVVGPTSVEVIGARLVVLDASGKELRRAYEPGDGLVVGDSSPEGQFVNQAFGLGYSTKWLRRVWGNVATVVANGIYRNLYGS